MDERELVATARAEFVQVSRSTISQVELALTRQIARAEEALSIGTATEAERLLRPMLADLKRLRAGVHRHNFEPVGIRPVETSPEQETARLFAELAFCSQHMSRIIDRLSQLNAAGEIPREIVPWSHH